MDVTVVLDTCREPDDRLPLDEPAFQTELHMLDGTFHWADELDEL